MKVCISRCIIHIILFYSTNVGQKKVMEFSFVRPWLLWCWCKTYHIYYNTKEKYSNSDKVSNELESDRYNMTGEQHEIFLFLMVFINRSRVIEGVQNDIVSVRGHVGKSE